jgi:HlyD family secretion protein
VAAPRKRKGFWIWLSIIVVVLLVAGGVALARLVKGGSIDANRMAKVTRGDVARSVVATGKIQPITKVEVKSKASGIVEKLYVDINNQVKKGQQLAQLDQQEIVAQVDAQKAQLASAEANVAAFEANIEQDKVNAAAPDLPMYKATLDRNQEMRKEGLVSQQAFDDTNKDYLAALTRRDSAKAQIGVDTAKLKQARAQVLQSQASLQQLEEQLSYTTIVAPMDGVILSRDVEIGDAVSSILVLGFDGDAGDDRGRYQPGVRGRQGGRGRYCPRVHGAAGAHQGGELSRPHVRWQGDQDCAAGGGERQRDHVRGAGVDRQPRRRIEGQHDGQRGDPAG